MLVVRGWMIVGVLVVWVLIVTGLVRDHGRKLTHGDVSCIHYWCRVGIPADRYVLRPGSIRQNTNVSW